MPSSSNPRPPVLILGAHIAALGVLRALVARGVTCYVGDRTSDVISHSRWYRAPGATLAETSDSTVLAAFLDSLRLRRAVLIGCSDRWASAIAGLPTELRDRFPASAPAREAVEQFVNKDRFSALVDRLDIPRPQTHPIHTLEDLDAVSEADLEGSFLKPTESQLHRRHFRSKGSFTHSRAEAAAIVERGRAAGISFILQEWIPGDLAATVLLDGFVDRDGQIRALVARRRVRMNPPRLGNTVSSVTISLAEVDEPVAMLRRLLAEVGYRGIFNVEFKRDERTGRYTIIELNPRPAWFIGTIARLGVDLPWMSYLDAQELPIEEPADYPLGRYAMYEFQDVASLFRSLRSLRRPEGPILRPWLSGDRALFWWTDPYPSLGGAVQAVTRRLHRASYRVRGVAAPAD
jgi:predicted ATP-grasp superfamily ATP-dependent carboligase